MQMHFYMSESFQLERLYVTNLLHRFSVNVCSEGTTEESNEMPVLSLFACIVSTLNRNYFGCNWGPVYGCKWQRTRIPGGRTRAVIGWKEPRLQNMGKQIFTGLCERPSKYHLALCVVIELWFREALLVAQDEQERRRERRLNLENQTLMSRIVYVCQVYLVLKRCKSCQFICSLVNRIRVLKEGRSALC